jgi:catechol 2,3-dioxygenase-like lactoylglutathione lyase family enzyme
MDYKLELVLIPVADADRAKAFYIDTLGWNLIVDGDIGGGKRIIQADPPGSACAIGFGVGVTDAPAGTAKGLHLVVTDIVAARDELVGRGAGVGPVRWYDPGEGGWQDGAHPKRSDYMSFAEFTDPDGNLWLLQERGFQGTMAA